jgi:hypothetical protein
MKTQLPKIDVTEDQLREVKALTPWPGAPTVKFSCNGKEIWPTENKGELRTVVAHPLLTELMRRLLDFRASDDVAGGRFFVERRGAYFKDEDGRSVWFVAFSIKS